MYVFNKLLIIKFYIFLDDICTFATNFKRDIQYLIPDVPEHLNHAFKSYANYHNKEYHKKEKQIRKSIFERNLR